MVFSKDFADLDIDSESYSDMMDEHELAECLVVAVLMEAFGVEDRCWQLGRDRARQETTTEASGNLRRSFRLTAEQSRSCHNTREVKYRMITVLLYCCLATTCHKRVYHSTLGRY
jgi:hypothetical protein